MFSIMVIEDNSPVRKGLIYDIRSKMPWLSIVAEAPDGISGYRLAAEHRPQIILTDIRLPGLSGLKMIRDLQKLYSPQVIVISGYTEFEYAREALSLGVMAYLVKPIDEEELESTLRHAAARICDRQELSPDALPPQRDPAETDSAAEAEENKDASMQMWYVNQTIAYIHTHYAENQSIADIAHALRMSESYLNRLFKESTSFTIHEYRSNYRISRAAELLAQPQYKIHEIAKSVGISNQRYFSNLFKKSMGVSPMEYRNAILFKK